MFISSPNRIESAVPAAEIKRILQYGHGVVIIRRCQTNLAQPELCSVKLALSRIELTPHIENNVTVYFECASIGKVALVVEVV